MDQRVIDETKNLVKESLHGLKIVIVPCSVRSDCFECSLAWLLDFVQLLTVEVILTHNHSTCICNSPIQMI